MMPDADKRIFDYFAANDETAQEIDYLAFASYAFAKFEWLETFRQKNGTEATQGEIDKWSSELPDSRLNEIHENAGRVFTNAARIYMADRIEKEKERAVSSSILDENKRHNQIVESNVRKATSFWRNLPANIFVGFLSSIIFSVILIVAAAIVTKDPSPFALFRSITSGDHPAPEQTAHSLAPSTPAIR